jgi:hypothetical protein
MWGSMLLMTMSTGVIIVLHSAEVVHIPHESRSSLIARYPLYRRVPLHTSGVCATTSLQGCSMVFPSLQHTHWGFTGGVIPDHQGSPLTPCGSHERPLPYPLIPNQTDPKRVHSIHTADWYVKLGSTTYYTRPYPYRLMVVCFHGWSLHEPVLRFGHDVYHRLLESTGQALNCQNPMNIISNPSPQIPILHTNREQQRLIGWQ